MVCRTERCCYMKLSKAAWPAERVARPFTLVAHRYQTRSSLPALEAGCQRSASLPLLATGAALRGVNMRTAFIACTARACAAAAPWLAAADVLRTGALHACQPTCMRIPYARSQRTCSARRSLSWKPRLGRKPAGGAAPGGASTISQSLVAPARAVLAAEWESTCSRLQAAAVPVI